MNQFAILVPTIIFVFSLLFPIAAIIWFRMSKKNSRNPLTQQAWGSSLEK